jgi:Tfp pilus assembly protein PilO
MKGEPRAAVFVLVIALLTVPAQIWFFTVEPVRRGQIRAADLDIAKLDLEIAEARAAERKYPLFRDEVVRLRAERDKLLQLLPPQPADASFPEQFSGAARDFNITLRSVRAGTATTEAAWIEQPYDIEAAAETLDPLAGYFSTFARSTRIASILRIELNRDGSRWRASARIVVPYERGDAVNSAATSSARTGRAK